jgi:ribonucleotide monophosphatase NagD (HAD superfamily)
MNCMNDIRGFLIDLDGVLYVGNRAIDGANEALEFLTKNGYPFRCISNTTRKCRRTIKNHLSSLGFDIPENHIFTPPLAAIAYMKKKERPDISSSQPVMLTGTLKEFRKILVIRDQTG